MKRTKQRRVRERDTIRDEYDFSRGVRGATAERYWQGTNVVLLDPEVAEVFPDTAAVSEALRILARAARRSLRRRRTPRA